MKQLKSSEIVIITLATSSLIGLYASQFFLPMFGIASPGFRGCSPMESRVMFTMSEKQPGIPIFQFPVHSNRYFGLNDIQIKKVNSTNQMTALIWHITPQSQDGSDIKISQLVYKSIPKEWKEIVPAMAIETNAIYLFNNETAFKRNQYGQYTTVSSSRIKELAGP